MQNQHLPPLGAELSPEERAELGSLEPLVARLAASESAPPSATDTARLVAQLRPLVAGRATPLPAPPAVGVGQWLRLARAQLWLVGHGFWWASAGVLLLGLAVGLLASGGALAVAFVLLAPLLAAGCVAYAFRPATRTMWELEQAAPVSLLELLYVRLAMVLLWNLALASLLLTLIAVQEPRLLLWRLLLLWLGPLLGLTGVALFATVRWGGLAGALLPLGLWALGMGLGWQYLAERLAVEAQFLDGLLALLLSSDTLLASALAALVAGLVLLVQSGRLVGGIMRDA
ncbi:MAG: hypothetical protein MUD01_16490 [Chloroflexaceae bacterium]|jgi:hypothetical protein|nr:hypothetical protein [Chloroflexaceae bacterium]